MPWMVSARFNPLGSGRGAPRRSRVWPRSSTMFSSRTESEGNVSALVTAFEQPPMRTAMQTRSQLGRPGVVAMLAPSLPALKLLGARSVGLAARPDHHGSAGRTRRVPFSACMYGPAGTASFQMSKLPMVVPGREPG
jgi:hypothetical protein